MGYSIIFDSTGKSQEEWLAARRLGIGGSDMGAIMGYSSWKSPVDVWMDKTSTEPPEQTESEFTYWGHIMEDPVAKEFEKRTGYTVIDTPFTYQSDEYPFLLANIDRAIDGLDAGLECKTAIEYKTAEWEGDNIPDTYYVQCQHYMAVTGAKSWWIACLIGGHRFVHKEIKRNDEFIEQMIEVAAQFWDMVQTNTMPAVDGSKQCSQALLKIHGKSNGKEVILPDTAETYVKEILAIDADIAVQEEQVDALKRKKSKCENILKDMLGQNEVGMAGDWKVSWKSVKPRVSIDTKLMQKEAPELYKQVMDQFSKVGSASRRFSIK